VRDNGAPPLTDTDTFNLTVREANARPVLAPIANATVKEGALLTILAMATDSDVPLNQLRFALGAGAPAGAAIDATSGVFTWRPREFQGPSSNQLSIVVTDNGVPPRSDSREFTVIVRDALSDFRLAVGSTDVTAGQGKTVSLHLVSGTELSQLEFRLDSPSSVLTNLRLNPLAPEIDSAVLLPQGNGVYAATFFVAAGSVLDGDRDIAQIGFDTVAGRSEVAPLLPRGVTALGEDGLTTFRGAGDGGRVFVVFEAPLLFPQPGPAVTIYGRPGKTYSLQAADDLDDPIQWQELKRVKLEGTSLKENLPQGGLERFLRAREVP
jgi:hypothetical protein